MGKLIPKEYINKKENLEILYKYREELCFEIYRITQKDLNAEYAETQIIDKVRKYAETHKKAYPENGQCGRIWFLVKENNKFLEISQVAQALDKGLNNGFFNEIICHVKEMLGGTEGKYKSLFNNNEKENDLVFYELEIDKYLEKFAPVNYKQTIYELAREYYAEASLAHFTQASEWGFNNSGMDKRAYYHILKNDIRKQIKVIPN
ncbi:MAG: hypothetical protein K2O91_01420 [Lachnospiraceae bacterium]|nr:hypothetical protein [Lachnospiraceae bacterium]